MGNSSLISELFNGPESALVWAILLISFVTGVIITWLIWRNKVKRLESEVANEKALALEHQAALTKAKEEIELKESDLKKAGLTNIKLRQDFEVVTQQKEDYMTEYAVAKDQVKDISLLNNAHKESIEDLQNQILGLKTKNNELSANTGNQSSANTNVEVYTLKTKLTKTNSELATALVAIKNLQEERDSLKKASENKPMAAAPTSNGVTAAPTKIIRRVVQQKAPETPVAKTPTAATPAAKTPTPESPKPVVTKKVATQKAVSTPKKVTPKKTTTPAKKVVAKKAPAKAAPKKRVAKKVEKERLRKVEGIGPKIEQLLHDNGILSFKQLSKSKSTKLKKILADAGSRYKMHDPTTWPEQAAMAAKGEWDKLKSYQDFLKGGVDTSKK